MNILIGQNHLDTLGGTETNIYTLIAELTKRGHYISLISGTDKFGLTSEKIYSDFNIIPNKLKKEYDVGFINHTSTIKRLLDSNIKCKTLYQICHGATPELEQPYGHPIEKYIVISEEVRDHLKSKSFESVVVRNGIDTERFKPEEYSSDLRKVLSLSHSQRFNLFLKKICDRNNWGFAYHNKYTNPVFDIENIIKQADLVVTLGRGAYESMACGKNVLVADWRPYQMPLMDGMITEDTIDNFIYNNCSGRCEKKTITEDSITEEIKKYSVENSKHNRAYALKNLNIQKQVDIMLSLVE